MTFAWSRFQPSHSARRSSRRGSAAAKSFASFPATEFLPILQSRIASAPVLAWALTCRPERALRETALQNTSPTDETIEGLAPSLSTALAELVVINQERLLRRPSMLEAIESNPGLSNDQRRRLRELRETFHIGEVPPIAATPIPAPAEPEPVPEVRQSTPVRGGD